MKRILIAVVCGALLVGSSAFAGDGSQKDGGAQKGHNGAQTRCLEAHLLGVGQCALDALETLIKLSELRIESFKR